MCIDESCCNFKMGLVKTKENLNSGSGETFAITPQVFGGDETFRHNALFSFSVLRSKQRRDSLPRRLAPERGYGPGSNSELSLRRQGPRVALNAQTRAVLDTKLYDDGIRSLAPFLARKTHLT